MLSGLINTAEKTMVAVGHIKADGGTQMRAGLDEATVNEYADAMAETGWGDFPPVVLYHDGTDYWLADGFHRLAAFRSLAAGVDALIPADVRSGTRRDAILHAAGANANHGLRRTNADKRRAVEVLLRDEEWRQWSDAEIARRCNVTPMTVGRVRKELIYNNVIDAPSQRTVQRDGVTYTQNTAKIGKKPIRYESGLPALQMPAPGAGAAPMAAKIPIEDWELEDIVEQVAQEYYGSVTARAGAEMTQQSQAHAGEYWAKLRRALDAFDVTADRIDAAVAATVERLVGERRALRPGSPEAKALTKEIKSATWGDQLLKQPQRYAEVWELERLLAQWAQSLDASVLRSTARLRGGAQWWEARKALQALTSLNYRDRDLVSALHNLANQKDAQAAETITDPVKGIVVDGDQPLPGWVDADAKQRTIDAAKRIAEATPAGGTAAPVSQREGYDSDEWYTPGWVIEAATAVMGQIDLDPASCELAQETVQAGLYWTKRQDGCRVGWFGRVWLNPPYSAPGAFVDKLIEEYTAGNVKQACVLLNNATETRWFQRLLARFPVCFFNQRLAFWRHDHEDVGARQGQALFYLGPDVEKFVEVFGEHGIVVKRLD